MSDEQPEIIKGWSLYGFGPEAYARLHNTCSMWIRDYDVIVDLLGEQLEIPWDVLTRFVERMNHVDPNAENDRKLGAAVRAAIQVHLTNSKETYSTKHTDELPVRLQTNGPHLSTDVMQAIASALRNEAAK